MSLSYEENLETLIKTVKISQSLSKLVKHKGINHIPKLPRSDKEGNCSSMIRLTSQDFSFFKLFFSEEKFL